MAYLQPTDYLNYGLPSSTSVDWITAATALINSFCRRPDLNVIEYTERLRPVTGSQTVMLSYLPLSPVGLSVTPLVSMQGRYTKPRRGEMATDPLFDVMCAFSLPGQWSDIDATHVDYDPRTGEVTLPWNIFGLPYNEVSITYTAGLEIIGDDIKTACAQIVRNAQATPALNTSMSKIDTMQLKYFSSSLLDETVKTWLKPYVSIRVG